MRNVVKSLLFFLICFLLVLSVSASPIPDGTYSLSGVLAGSSPLTGTITLNASGLATAANLRYNNATYASPTFSNIASSGLSGISPTADFAYISGSNGQVTLYYFTTVNAFGNITFCESGGGCAVASSLQIYTPNYQAGLAGGDLSSAAASTATPELSTWILLMTGLLMIAAVLALRGGANLTNASPTA